MDLVSSAKGTPRILLVDDDEAVRRFVGAVLKRNGYTVVPAGDGQAAITEAIEHSPHLIILDLSLPVLNGLDVCRQLRTWYHAPVLVLSAYGEENLIVKALDLGADDYLTKPFRPGELLARIRALLRRSAKQPVSKAFLRAGNLKLDLARRRVFRDNQEIALTRTEFDILAYLARQLDRVVPAEMILQEVWGPHHGQYEQTLRVHIGHIRKKIEPDPAEPRYILTESGVGYRLASPQASRRSASQPRFSV
jgi:two-component system KDP operon response regulator KdpE